MSKTRRRMAVLLATLAVIATTAVVPASLAGSFTCQNGGGNTPSSGKCSGEGLTNVNPGGNAPPGQQP